MNRFRRGLVTAILVGAVGAIGGCGGKKEGTKAKAPMTQAQRDSAIAASKLPGASVAGRALATSDSARARAQRTDNASAE